MPGWNTRKRNLPALSPSIKRGPAEDAPLKIIINDWQKKERIRKKWIKALAEKTLRLEGYCGQGEVGIALTDNRKIRELNRKYRKVDRATDVIAFPLEDPRPSLPPQPAPLGRRGGFKEGELLGDVVISLERARSQAREYKHSRERELAILIIHGLLHLLGYDHGKKREAEVMTRRERTISSRISSRVTNPAIPPYSSTTIAI